MQGELDPYRLNEDGAYFRELVTYTASTFGFSPHLVEKDYFCSVLLRYLASEDSPLVFKGGTLLTKVHDSFYRISEDLDFTIPIEPTASRSQRSASVGLLKSRIDAIAETFTAFSVDRRLVGSNESRQYAATVVYQSALDGRTGRLEIEVSLREELATPAVRLGARTLLLSPITELPAVPEVQVISLSRLESYAEKCRAALTRERAAIRDLFDLDHAMINARIDLTDPDLLRIVVLKLAIPDNPPINVSEERRQEFRAQLASELEPVVRAEDFARFDLERAFNGLRTLARDVEQHER